MMRDVRFVEFKTGKSELQEEERNRRNREMDYRAEIGKPVIVMICGTLIYYHCAYRNSTLLTLVSDVLIVLLCSLAILGLLFRQINISYSLSLSLSVFIFYFYFFAVGFWLFWVVECGFVICCGVGLRLVDGKVDEKVWKMKYKPKKKPNKQKKRRF